MAMGLRLLAIPEMPFSFLRDIAILLMLREFDTSSPSVNASRYFAESAVAAGRYMILRAFQVSLLTFLYHMLPLKLTPRPRSESNFARDSAT